MQGTLYVDDFVINLKILTMLKDNYSFVFIKFKTGPMRMASHSQKLKLLVSIFVSCCKF